MRAGGGGAGEEGRERGERGVIRAERVDDGGRGFVFEGEVGVELGCVLVSGGERCCWGGVPMGYRVG